MSNALKKITTRAKALKKKHPHKQWKTLVKQAGKEYRTGTMPKKRKHARKKSSVTGKRKYKVTHRVKKVGKKRARKATRKKSTTAVRVKTRTRTVTKYRRVGASGDKTLMGVAVVAALGIGAYLLLKPSTKPPATGAGAQLVMTGNATRDTAAQNILAYAQAANLGISAITDLISALNTMPAAQVQAAAQNPAGSINTLLALPAGGPSATLNV